MGRWDISQVDSQDISRVSGLLRLVGLQAVGVYLRAADIYGIGDERRHVCEHLSGCIRVLQKPCPGKGIGEEEADQGVAFGKASRSVDGHDYAWPF